MSRPHSAPRDGTWNKFSNEIASSCDFIGLQTAEDSPLGWCKKVGPISGREKRKRKDTNETVIFVATAASNPTSKFHWN